MWPSILAWLLISVFMAQCASKSAGDADCDCFLTNGSTPTYFSHHKFFDFRSLDKYAGVPDIITDPGESADASPSSDYFESDEWANTWGLQSWNNTSEDGHGFNGDAKYLLVNSPSNVYIEKGDNGGTFMTMRTKRLPKFQTAAEFESTSSNYRFLSARMLARTVGGPGAVTALFTYRDDSGELADVQEADIEILTRGPRDRIQYTNQPSYTDDDGDMPQATRNATMPNGLEWSDWAVHRLDWTPGRSVWYVEGEEVASIAFQAPRDAAGVVLNSWGDGGSWSGVMPLYDEAYLQVQWLEMVYNTTADSKARSSSARSPAARSLELDPKRAKRARGQCGVVCSIDEAEEAGAVKVLSDSAASRSPGQEWPRILGLSVALCISFFF